jgi:hypothetical protein
LLVTQETFSQLLSPQITDKLPVVEETKTLKFGTLLENVNSLLSKMLTLTGYHALNSIKIPKTQLLSVLLGIKQLKFGTIKQ